MKTIAYELLSINLLPIYQLLCPRACVMIFYIHVMKESISYMAL